MSNPKWEIGPVKLMDGSEGHIYFVQPESKHQRYIGKAKDNSGEWRALHWCDSGRVPYTTTGHAKNLAPPPKKTVRVQLWINVYTDGPHALHPSKESALAGGEHARFACIEIDREVTEGEGI
jgi:hypothetical protein